MKIHALSILLSICLCGCTTTDTTYSLQKAVNAAGEALNGSTQFVLLNLPDEKGDAGMLLSYLNQVPSAEFPLVIASPSLNYIHDLLQTTMNGVGDRRYDGTTLVIVGPKGDKDMFAKFAVERGFNIILTSYE
jgi:hypothetical protein